MTRKLPTLDRMMYAIEDALTRVIEDISHRPTEVHRAELAESDAASEVRWAAEELQQAQDRYHDAKTDYDMARVHLHNLAVEHSRQADLQNDRPTS